MRIRDTKLRFVILTSNQDSDFQISPSFPFFSRETDAVIRKHNQRISFYCWHHIFALVVGLWFSCWYGALISVNTSIQFIINSELYKYHTMQFSLSFANI